MGKFKVDYKSSKNATEAYDKVKAYLGNAEDIRKLDDKMQCTFEDAKKLCKIQGSQFKADITVLDSATGSTIEVHVDLPFLLMAFKSKIEEMLKKNLSKHVG
ncbi:MAG: polyhydroxyalkanoic acid system family protein [Pseudobdellovibrionaceae bacterium]